MKQSSIPISVVIFTKDEERNIRECIESARNFDQIIILDSCSTDKTREIAESMGIELIDFKWDGKYPKKRQWSLMNLKTKHEWVLFLDADERITVDLQIELLEFCNESISNYAAGMVEVDYYFGGRKLNFGIKPKKIILMNRFLAEYPVIQDENNRGMGELEGHFQPIVNGKVKKLRSRILHNDRDPILDWFARHVRYADWESKVISEIDMRLVVNSNKPPLAQIFHKLPAKPILFFIYCYFFKLGFLDGKAGLHYALAKSWYYWIVDLACAQFKDN